MVEQQTLTLYIAVRVRVPQPRCATARFRAVFYLFSNISTEFESLVLKNGKIFELSNFFVI